MLSVTKQLSLAAAAIGAVGSVALTLYAGRHNNSLLLKTIFAIWVVSPFVGLAAANLASKHWSVITRSTLFTLTLLIVLGSLSIYGVVAFGPPRGKTAPMFVIVPPASCLLIVILVPLAAFASRKRSR